jgi:uncharacterized protein YecE (DUF72 family)
LSVMSAKLHLKVGCCGFGMAQKDYMDTFPTVEVQHTFYEPPQIKTLQKWKAAAPDNFEFAIKAWQLITHTAKSPTFRRLKTELSERDAAGCGSFQNSAIVNKAWDTTLACAEALGAERILFQCPASFKPTDQNVEQLTSFFQRNNNHKHLKLFWEPRGDFWPPALIKQLCSQLGIFHAVDPFVHESVTPSEIYYRLHGKGGWRYDYNAGELDELVKDLRDKSEALVFFNNVTMVDNARAFQRLS